MSKLQNFPDQSRLWIFTFGRQLNTDEYETATQELTHFIANWQSHEQKLSAEFEIVHDHFLFLVCDDSKVMPSGCSQDSMRHAIVEIETKLGISLLRTPPVVFRNDDGQIETMARDQFVKNVKRGKVFKPETVVFNNTHTHLESIRKQHWEVQLQDSWHGEIYAKHSPEVKKATA